MPVVIRELFVAVCVNRELLGYSSNEYTTISLLISYSMIEYEFLSIHTAVVAVTQYASLHAPPFERVLLVSMPRLMKLAT